MHVDIVYRQLVRDVLDCGETRKDRTGVGTISLFGTQSRYDLRSGFPLLTTKKVAFGGVVTELLWFLRGSTNCNELGKWSKLWSPWAQENGELGPVYGKQWRDWNGIDQIATVVDSIRNNPNSRRHIVSAWNVSELDQMALPPCHTLFQFYVWGKYLDCQLYQRSADLAVGVPFNIASYALLTSMIAQVCDLSPRYLVHTIGDAHIYLNHIAAISDQIYRFPREQPTLKLGDLKLAWDRSKFRDLDPSLICIVDYNPQPAIKYDVAV